MAIGDQSRTRQYSVSRGQIYFKKSGTAYYKQLGNTPELSFNQEIADLSHYSSRSGTNTRDAYVVLQQDVMSSFVLDEFSPENLQNFFMSTLLSETTQTAAAKTVQITSAVQGGVYDLGFYNWSSAVVSTTGGSPDWTLNTDYEIDLVGGILLITTSSGISGINIQVTGSVTSTSLSAINAATANTVKGDFMFIGDPPIGPRLKITGYCALKPGGDIPMISDEWAQMPFEAEFEENTSYTGLIDVVHFGYVS